MEDKEMAKAKIMRCVGCGKPLEPGQPVVMVVQGKLSREAKMTKPRLWGKLHLECFNHAMPSPDAVLEEMRRQVANE